MPKLDGQEIVLCSPASVLTEVGGLDGFLGAEDGPVERVVDHLLRSADWRPRTEDLERDPSWLQWVPYGVPVYGGRVFAYRRAKAGQEGRLHGKASLGIGGHVNAQDGRGASCIDRSVLHAALVREFTEEIRPTEPGWWYGVSGLLHDPSNVVGSVHLGAVYLVELDSADITPAPEIEPLGWFTPGELASSEHHWESWSQILLPHLPSMLGLSVDKNPLRV